jgi:glycosyltransferase involved in cell wall biosynthesis
MLSERHWDPDDVTFYTFWFSSAAYGFASLKQQFPNLNVVSKAHGDDLYETRHRPRYIPFRRSALQLIDGVYPDSEAGVAYLKHRWPETNDKIILARLGVEGTGQQASRSTDGVLRIVTCSSLTEVKRVGLFVRGLDDLARQRPKTRIEWNHFGDGQLRPVVEAAAGQLPSTVSRHFHGHVPVETIQAWYRDRPVDIFVNVSSSEGTPVSIMEAISHGIPVVATGVGGNCEIVEPENGILLPSDPTASEIASALETFLVNPDRAVVLRAGSLRVWKRKYDAAANFTRFVTSLQGGD